MNPDDHLPEGCSLPDYQKEAIEQCVAILRDKFTAFIIAVETGEEHDEAVIATHGPLSTRIGLAEIAKTRIKDDGLYGCPDCR